VKHFGRLVDLVVVAAVISCDTASEVLGVGKGGLTRRTCECESNHRSQPFEFFSVDLYIMMIDPRIKCPYKII